MRLKHSKFRQCFSWCGNPKTFFLIQLFGLFNPYYELIVWKIEKKIVATYAKYEAFFCYITVNIRL